MFAKERHLDRQAADVINATTNSGLKYAKDEEEIDVCEAIRQMREESENNGIQKGMEQGRIEGERLLSALIQKLIGANRMGDVKKAAEDEEARKSFYREFGMLD